LPEANSRLTVADCADYIDLLTNIYFIFARVATSL